MLLGGDAAVLVSLQPHNHGVRDPLLEILPAHPELGHGPVRLVDPLHQPLVFEALRLRYPPLVVDARADRSDEISQFSEKNEIYFQYNNQGPVWASRTSDWKCSALSRSRSFPFDSVSYDFSINSHQPDEPTSVKETGGIAIFGTVLSCNLQVLINFRV